MSVSNGQIANQNTFNNAFVSKQTLNQDIDGTINLTNTSSGADVDNVQQTINDIKTVNANQDSSITAIEADLGDAINTSIGPIDANKLLRTDADGFVSGSTQRYLGPSYADDAAANARYGGKFGGEVYYDFTLNIYKQWSVSASAWVPLSRDEDLTAAIAVRASDADENKMIKTHDDGWLSKTLLKFPANSYASDSAAATAYGILSGGEFYYNTTDNAYKFYNGTTWTTLNAGAISLTLNDLTDVDTAGVADGDVLTYDSGTSTWIAQAPSGSAPTAPLVTRYTSGSGTWNRTGNPIYITVEMVGGGGGGGGSREGAPGTLGGTGGSGGNTTFGASLLTANGGSGGGEVTIAGPGNGGSLTVNSPAVAVRRCPGSTGNAGTYATTSQIATASGGGGVTPLGGGGGGTIGSRISVPAIPNSGSGGGGASTTQVSIQAPGSGGGAGGYLLAIITSPSSSYSYSVGTGGAGGSSGTSGAAGGAGGSGIIVVTEYYQ